jgi:hypothetical protein
MWQKEKSILLQMCVEKKRENKREKFSGVLRP